MKTIKTKVVYEFEFDAQGLMEEHVDVKGLAKDETMRALEDAIVNEGLTSEDVEIISIDGQEPQFAGNSKHGEYDACNTCKCNTCTNSGCENCNDCSGTDMDHPEYNPHHLTGCMQYTGDKSDIAMSSIYKNLDDFNMSLSARIASGNCKSMNPEEYSALEQQIQSAQKLAYNLKEDLNRYQIQRQDEVENAVFNMVKTLTCNPNMEWDASVICDIADTVCDELVDKGYLVYYPSRVTDKDDNITITDFHNF